MLLALLAGPTIVVYSQGQAIRGIVLDERDGTPIPNVTIFNPEAEIRIRTGKDGGFGLWAVKSSVTLRFSHIGHTPVELTVILPVDTTLVVMMRPEANTLEEIVIATGYENTTLARTTGAFEKIDNDLLNRNVGADILSRLDNTSSGIFFDKSFYNFNRPGIPDHEISMHGITNLRGNSANAPLIILDSFPYDGDISNINPNEIESVTLLKDAAASSIWGAKAGNGVIVLTSKKAANHNRWVVNFNQHVKITDKPDIFGHQIVNNADLIDVERYLFEQGFYDNRENNRSRPALPPAVEAFILLRDGKASEAETQLTISQLSQQDIRNDLLKYVYLRPIDQQYALNISHSTPSHSMVLSAGVDKGRGTIVGNKHDRLTFRFSNDITAIKNLTVHTNVRYSYTGSTNHTVGGDTPFSYSNNGYPYPYTSFKDHEGNPIPIPHQYRMGFLDTVGNGMLLDWHYRPFEELNRPANSTRSHELIADVGLRYQWWRHFYTDVKYQYLNSRGLSNRFLDLDRYETRNNINRGSEIVGNNVIYHYPFGGWMRTSNRNSVSQRARMQLTYQRHWQGDHDVAAFVGGEINRSEDESGGMDIYGYNKNLLTFANNIDHTKRYPVYANLAANASIPYPVLPQSATDYRYVSLFVNGSYSFKGKYVVTASARRDASNLFGVSINNKWTPLWSAGLAWNISDEHFFPTHAIPLLKFRASYGFSGNVDNSMSALVTLNYSVNQPVTEVDLPRATILRPPNPELRWEKVMTNNIGLDFALLNHRLSGSVDYYVKHTHDLIENFPLDPTTGARFMMMNVGNTKSKGVDFRLTSKNMDTWLDWTTTAWFSYNNNWVTRTYRDYISPLTFLQVGALTAAEGHMAYSAFSYRWAGLDPQTGEPQGFIDGVESKDYRTIMSSATTLDDLKLHGSSRPLYWGSVLNAFRWRRLTVSANITYRLAYYFRRQSIDYSSLANNSRVHVDFYKRWQQPGDERYTDVPSFRYPIESVANSFYMDSEILMERADNIRLQDVRIDYNVPMLGRNIGNMNVFVNLNNVGFIWRKNGVGLDPDINGNIAAPMSFALGLNLQL